MATLNSELSTPFPAMPETKSIPIDHEVVQLAVEDGTQSFVEDAFDVAQAMPPRRVQNDQMPAAQPVDGRLQILEMHVTVADRSLAVSRAVEGALDEQDLG